MASVGKLLGLTWEEPVDGSLAPPFAFGDGTPAPGLRRVTTSLGGPMRIELLEGQPGSVWYTTKPTELHHVAYWVDADPVGHVSIEVVRSEFVDQAARAGARTAATVALLAAANPWARGLIALTHGRAANTHA
jgi:hypothetical protein